MAVILVKANGERESKIRESIILATWERLVGGVDELENKSNVYL